MVMSKMLCSSKETESQGKALQRMAYGGGEVVCDQYSRQKEYAGWAFFRKENFCDWSRVCVELLLEKSLEKKVGTVIYKRISEGIFLIWLTVRRH